MKLPFTLKQLQILKAIASEKNFTKAAKLLLISQPSLSKQIQILENKLGVVLITRDNNNIKFTENGKIFLEYVERILSLCEESCRTLNDINNNYRINLRIGTSETINNLLLYRILIFFITNYPQINFEIYINSSKKIQQRVIMKQVDIALITYPLITKKNIKYKIKKFISDPFVVIISNYNLLSKPSTTLIVVTQLLTINFIKLNSKISFNKLIKEQLKILDRNKKFKTIIKLNSQQATKIAVNLGFGFSFVPIINSLEEKELKLIQFFKIKNIRLKRQIYLIINHRNKTPKPHKFFIEELFKLKNTII